MSKVAASLSLWYDYFAKTDPLVQVLVNGCLLLPSEPRLGQQIRPVLCSCLVLVVVLVSGL